MKDQYFGDVNDFRKYGLLRCLTEGNRVSASVCWALTPSDGRSDGSKTEYLGNPGGWRSFDPELFTFLKRQVLERVDRRVSAIEASKLLPSCLFFAQEIPSDELARDRYFEKLRKVAADTHLVFFDPDNGLGVKSAPRGGPNSRKYVYPSELAPVFEGGQSILLYQHFPRRPRVEFTEALARSLCTLLGANRAVGFTTAHVLFLLIPQGEHWPALLEGTRRVERRWRGQIGVSLLCAPEFSHATPLESFDSRASAPAAS
jgi:hypothetical protein